jgi:hypothetical protein
LEGNGGAFFSASSPISKVTGPNDLARAGGCTRLHRCALQAIISPLSVSIRTTPSPDEASWYLGSSGPPHDKIIAAPRIAAAMNALPR